MLSSQVNIFSLIKAYARKLAIISMMIALVAFAWSNIFFHSDLNAYAATAEGIGNQIQGKVDQDIGSLKRNTGDLTDDKSVEIKGGLQQAKGKATQALGTSENKLDEAKNAAQDQSESLIDSVKEFFE